MDDTDGGADVRAARGGPGRSVLALASTSVASTIGLLAAGIALVTVVAPAGGADGTASGLPVGNAVRVAALVAVLMFVARRRGKLPNIAGVIASLASLVVVGGGLLTTLDVLSFWTQPLGIPLAAIMAGVAAIYGLVDALELPDERVVRGTFGTVTAASLGFLGYITASFVAAIPILALGGAPSIVPRTTEIGSQYVILTVISAIGFGLFTLAYFRISGIQPSKYVDLRWPSLRDIGIVVVGVVALVVVNAGANWVIQLFDLPFAPSQIENTARDQGRATFLLYLIPLSLLAVAPGEELVYRNVVQKYLYDSLGRWGAILVASGIFAVIHGSQYANEAPAATLISLALVYALALVLGIAYERTDNLVVPILIHGAFNAYSFVLMYTAVSSEPTPGVV